MMKPPLISSTPDGIVAEWSTSTSSFLQDAWERGETGVSRKADHFVLSPEFTWSLPDESLHALGINRLAEPVRLREASGVPGKSRYCWRLIWPHDTRLVGCALERAGTIIVVPPEVLALPGLCERVAGASRLVVFRCLLRVQRMARQCPFIHLEGRLAGFSVREADKVQVVISGGPDDPVPSIQLVEASAAPDVSTMGSNETDWTPTERLTDAPNPIGIPDGVLFDDLVSRCVDDSVVHVKPRNVVIIPKGVFQNAVLAKAAADQPLEVRRRFAENPTAFLPVPEAFDEKHYSARVVGVGEAPRQSEHDGASPRSWADPGDGLLLDFPTGTLFVEHEALAELLATLENAAARGAAEAVFRGVSVPCNPSILDAVRRAASLGNVSAGGKSATAQQRHRVLVLRIQENEVVLDWAPVRGGGRVAPLAGLPCLAPGVSLRLHQQQAFSQLRNLWVRGETGALLCDDMGLGKTIQALVFAAWVEAQIKLDGGPPGADPVHLPVMVVAPPSLLEAWLSELSCRLPGDCFARVLWGAGSRPGQSHGREVRLLKDFRCDTRKTSLSTKVVEHARLGLSRLREYAPSVLFIGYDALRSMQFAVGALRVGLLIADEVQQVKNPSSLRSHAIRAMNYDFALALTGTPIENSWTDLWTICDFATPGLLGPLTDFRRDYPTSGDVRKLGPRLAHALREVFIRRTRGMALTQLPPCDFRSCRAEMPPDQALAYRAEIARYSGGGREVLGLLQGLARVSLHPRIRATLSSRIESREWLKDSARTAILLDALDRWQSDGEAVIVFVRTIAMQETLSAALCLIYGLNDVGILNGRLTFPARQHLVAEFKDGTGFRILLVSPDVGGAGWNLQFAARSFLLERPFNPAVEAQMIARTWRLGQTQRVQVLAPVATLEGVDSFDEILDNLLQEKREIAESVLAPAVVENRELVQRFSRLLDTGDDPA